jgi:PPM family protein phosphatase
MRVAAHTDRGPRENLEDAAGACAITPMAGGRVEILLVLDGVGGNLGGEVASALGLAHLSARLTAVFSMPGYGAPAPDDVINELIKAFEAANEVILQQASQNGQLTGMATTAVCVVIVNGQAYFAWVGDSRCYLSRNGILWQVTRDHSAIQQLIGSGVIEAGDAKFHPLAHTITRYLGQATGFAVGTAARRIRPGDLIILCTDGLTDVLTEDQIARRVADCRRGDFDIDDLPRQLVNEALDAGTSDNTTVLCAHYLPSRPDEFPPSDMTLTGAYPVELATVMQQLLENAHE